MSDILQEMESQPEVWRAVLQSLQAQHGRFSQALQQSTFSRIILTGCGTTYFLADFTAWLLRLYTTYETHTCPASEIWLMPDLKPAGNSLLVAFSRSGMTTETIQAVARYRAAGGAQTALITCNASSPLGELAEMWLEAPAAQEASVIETRSFTSMALLAAAFAYLIGGRKERLAVLDMLPAELERLEASLMAFPAAWADPARYTRYFFLGSGPLYGMACEAMIKVKEMSLGWAEAFHTLEFRHGPMSLVDDKTLVFGLVSDIARQHEIDVLRDLSKLGAGIVLCDGGQNDLAGWVPDYRFACASEIDPWLRGVLLQPFVQRLGYLRGLALGLDPDRPTHLKPVTEL